MRIVYSHSFALTPEEAVRLQQELAAKIVSAGGPDPAEVRFVAGADASYAKGGGTISAAVVVLKVPELSIVERAWAELAVGFPYIPGLLTFREGPALLEAFGKIRAKPDVILFDGQGIAHPRGLGIASHIGLLLETPSIGVAKRLLVGQADEPGEKKGSIRPIRKNGEVIGMAVRTKDRVRPVYVSVGHRIDLERAVALVLKTARGYRLPEPTRAAHRYANEIRVRGGERDVQRTLEE